MNAFLAFLAGLLELGVVLGVAYALIRGVVALIKRKVNPPIQPYVLPPLATLPPAQFEGPTGTATGGAGLPIDYGFPYGMKVTADGLTLVASSGRELLLPVTSLLELRTDGAGLQTKDGGFFGGGVGIEGAALGILAASVLNGATTKTTLDSRITIVAVEGEVTMSMHRLTPTHMDNFFAPLRVNMRRTAITSSTQQLLPVQPSTDAVLDALERAVALRASGVLTPAEFDAQKARLLSPPAR